MRGEEDGRGGGELVGDVDVHLSAGGVGAEVLDALKRRSVDGGRQCCDKREEVEGDHGDLFPLSFCRKTWVALPKKRRGSSIFKLSSSPCDL